VPGPDLTTRALGPRPAPSRSASRIGTTPTGRSIVQSAPSRWNALVPFAQNSTKGQRSSSQAFVRRHAQFRRSAAGSVPGLRTANHMQQREGAFRGRKHTTEYSKNAIEALAKTMDRIGIGPGRVAAWVGTWDCHRGTRALPEAARGMAS
jgi:hypothetical protein